MPVFPMNAMSSLVDFSLGPRAVTQEERARALSEWRLIGPIDREAAGREPMVQTTRLFYLEEPIR